jgi:hypothetical protein
VRSRSRDEGDLGLDFGLQHFSERHFLVVVEAHVGEQHAEVRRVDAELLLNRLRGETDLAPDEAPALFQRMLGVRVLNGVCGVHAAGRQLLADRRDGVAALRCAAQPCGHAFDGLGV